MEIIFETADCEKVQATTVIFRENWAYLKINSLVKTPLHEFMAVARSGLWAPGLGAFVSILTTPAWLESSSKDKVKTESLIVGDVKYLLTDALHSKSKRYF